MMINVKLFFFNILIPFYFILFINSAFSAPEIFVMAEPSLRQVKLSGFTRARTIMQLATEVSGKVKIVFADIGESIPLEGKFACLNNTFVNIDIKTANNEIAQYQADVSYFDKQVSRLKKLVAKKNAAISQLDDLIRQLTNVRGKLNSAQLKKQRLQETRLRHCIEVPAGWRVIERNIQPGQWINIGEPVGKVGDYQHLIIPFSLSRKELISLKNKKNNIKVTLVDYNQEALVKIDRISPAFDEHTHKIQVELLLQGELPDYRGGMRVELMVNIPDEFGAFRIASKALDERFEEFWLKRKNGEVIPVKILGRQGDDFVRVISSDIRSGDQFMVLHR